MSSNVSTVGEVTTYSLPLSALVMYATLGAIGILGNGLVLAVIAATKELRDITSLLIANQSVIDLFSSVLLLVFFVLPQVDLPIHSYPLASFICRFWLSQYLFWLCLMASAFNLVVLTLERYFAVVYPIYYMKRVLCFKVSFFAALSWIVSAVFMSNVPIFSSVKDRSCYLLIWPSKEVQKLFGVLTFFLQFLIPIVTMVVVYTRIEVKLRSRILPNGGDLPTNDTLQIDPTGSQGSASNNQPIRERVPVRRRLFRRSIIKTLFTVIICYTVCWTPNQVLFLYYNLGGHLDFSGLPYYFTVFLAFGSMCINPFIYTFKYNRFQKGLKKLLGITSFMFQRTVNNSTNM